MATKKRTILRLSCYFEYGQSKSFEIDPKRGDRITESAKELVITRRDVSKTVITIDKTKLAYSVLSHVQLEDTKEHPAFQNLESEDIEFRG